MLSASGARAGLTRLSGHHTVTGSATEWCSSWAGRRGPGQSGPGDLTPTGCSIEGDSEQASTTLAIRTVTVTGTMYGPVEQVPKEVRFWTPFGHRIVFLFYLK